MQMFPMLTCFCVLASKLHVFQSCCQSFQWRHCEQLCQVSTCRRLRPAASWLISTPRSHCHVPINLCVCRTPPPITPSIAPTLRGFLSHWPVDSEEQVHPLVCFWRLLCACVLSYMHLDSWCTSWYKPTESLLFQEEKWKTCPAVKFWWSLMLFRSLRRL